MSEFHFYIDIPQEDQLRDLRSTFGSNLNWVEVDVPMTHYEATSYLGYPCNEYHIRCPVCKGWDKWYDTSMVTVLLGREDILKIMRFDENDCKYEDKK